MRKGDIFSRKVRKNNYEVNFFHRMLCGVSRTVTEYIGKGDPYDKVRKIYSINIVYFELGQGKDYVYHGKTEFKGVHEPHDLLKLSAHQSEKFLGIKEADIDRRRPAGVSPDKEELEHYYNNLKIVNEWIRN